MRLVRPTGTTKNRPTANTIATTTVPTQAPLEIGSSSSGSCALAEMPSALKPIFRDSTRATTPRMIGQRRTRCRFSHDTSGKEETSISPWAPCSGSSLPSCRSAGTGFRTATAQVEMPRIITPSSTAWPPTGASRWAISSPSGIRTGSAADCDARGAVACTPPGLRSGLGGLALGGAALEALDATAGVHELLAPRVERVAVRADLDVQLGLGRARGELVAAGAADVRLDVFGMDLGLHEFDSTWVGQGRSRPGASARCGSGR